MWLLAVRPWDQNSHALCWKSHWAKWRYQWCAPFRSKSSMPPTSSSFTPRLDFSGRTRRWPRVLPERWRSTFSLPPQTSRHCYCLCCLPKPWLCVYIARPDRCFVTIFVVRNLAFSQLSPQVSSTLTQVVRRTWCYIALKLALLNRLCDETLYFVANVPYDDAHLFQL